VKKLFLFLVNFIVFSILLYFIWLYLQAPYTSLLGHVFSFWAQLFDAPLSLAIEKTYISITSSQKVFKIQSNALIANMIALMALVLATPNLSLKKKIIFFPLSCFVLFVYHLLSLLVILGVYGIPPEKTGILLLLRKASGLVFSFSEQIGKIVMPFLIWLLFTHRAVFGKISVSEHTEGEQTSAEIDSPEPPSTEPADG